MRKVRFDFTGTGIQQYSKGAHMQVFYLTLNQMLVIFSFIIIGFLLRKKRLLPDDAGIVMAKLETYIFVPALSLYTQMTKCTVKNFKENSNLLLYGVIIVIAVILLAYPLSRLFIRKSWETPEKTYKRDVYKYALAFGNFGFVGNFIILGIWGEDFFFKYSLFTLAASIACNSWGLYTLIPKDAGEGLLKKLKKGLLTLPIIAVVSGMVIGLLDFGKYVPGFFITALDNAAMCQGPVAMVLAGFIMGGYDFKKLITNKKVYIATFLRLVGIPAAMMLVLKAIGADDNIMTLALIAFACPLGLNTIVFPAAYGGETETGASMAMISHMLSVITIPLMYLVFIVML